MFYGGLASLVLAGAALAQTPPDFSPNVTAHLDVKFGTKTVTPGLLLTKTDTANPPTIGTGDAPLSGSNLFIMLDIDVPGALVGGAAGSRVVNLHALITDYTSATNATDGVYILSSKQTGPATYLAPAPPAETPAYAHKYVQLLFPQPAGFAIPDTQTAAISKRIGFNLTTFVADSKLGSAVAANYFTEGA